MENVFQPEIQLKRFEMFFLKHPFSFFFHSQFVLLSAKFVPPKKEAEGKTKKDKQHNIDYKLTVKTIIMKIRSNFPQTFENLQDGEFLRDSRTFVDSLLASPENLSQVLETLPSNCEFCGTVLDNWSYKEPKSYFIALGHIRKIRITVKFCPTCRRSFYPDLYEKGIIFIHNKFMLCIETLLDILNSLKNNGSLIETIKDKLKLLGQLGGLSAEDMDLTNNSIKGRFHLKTKKLNFPSLLVC